jgi:hypothetical protein
MKSSLRLITATLLLAPFVPLGSAQTQAQPKTGASKPKITWKKIVIDKTFRSEGVGVGDFNKDGKMDIFVGDVWYEAPDWKMHEVRPSKKWDAAKGYSESFCCFVEDFNGDGYPDVIVIPFPGKPCSWYENPGPKGGTWPAHLLTNSACNETPIYVDLFGNGKKVLVMGWQPPGKDNEGEMCYFTPGPDPTQPWQRISISGPSEKGKEVPGTRRFSHGLGHGDVNGDGRVDIITPDGWWEQPEKFDGVTPWKFHPNDLKPVCADMFTYDVDGDGKADIVATSAHLYGFWWHQQKSGSAEPSFVRHDFFLPPPEVVKLSEKISLVEDEFALFYGVKQARTDLGKASWKMNPELNALARATAEGVGGSKPVDFKSAFKGTIKHVHVTRSSRKDFKTGEEATKASAKELLPNLEKSHDLLSPALEIGVGFARAEDGYVCAVVIGDSGAFSLPAQTHALHCVDINGDGLKDFVTGRRWWAHGPKGDAAPNDPAYLYWFEAKKDGSGMTTFIPHEIDDDSGVGTQFAIMDMNGDGLLDIIISNKKGVFLFLQQRESIEAGPGMPPTERRKGRRRKR